MSRPAPNTRLPASATEPELMQPPMDNRCPACRADLQGRYLGAIDIRCPDCAAPLRYNLHPAENGPWHLEVGIYLAGFASLVVVSVAGILLDWSPLSTLLATIASTTAYACQAWRRARKRIPQDWPRWRDETSASRGDPPP